MIVVSTRREHTSPSSCTVVNRISASISTTLAIDAGIVSTGLGAGADDDTGAGREAARVAANVVILSTQSVSKKGDGCK
jgi:hypothetical protein